MSSSLQSASGLRLPLSDPFPDTWRTSESNQSSREHDHNREFAAEIERRTAARCWSLAAAEVRPAEVDGGWLSWTSTRFVSGFVLGLFRIGPPPDSHCHTRLGSIGLSSNRHLCIKQLRLRVWLCAACLLARRLSGFAGNARLPYCVSPHATACYVMCVFMSTWMNVHIQSCERPFGAWHTDLFAGVKMCVRACTHTGSWLQWWRQCFPSLLPLPLLLLLLLLCFRFDK